MPADRLTWRLPDGALSFASTATVHPLSSFIGQDQALAAIGRAVSIKGPGFNVFVAGPRAAGRLGSIERILREIAPPRRSAHDYVYVKNFLDPARPKLLVFPPGRGLAFRKELLRVATMLLEEVPALLNRDEVRRVREGKRQAAEVEQHKAMARLEAHAQALGFVIGALGDEEGGQSGPIPLYRVPSEADANEESDDEEMEPQVLSRPEVQVLAEQGEAHFDRPVAEILVGFDTLEAELAKLIDVSRQTMIETLKAVSMTEAKAIGEGVAPTFRDLSRRFAAARGWLAELMEELVECPEWFDAEEPDHESLFAAFTVNLVHVGEKKKRAAIIKVTNPTWSQLLGGLEGEPGAYDHRSIRAGALVDASGGWLVINAADLLQEPGAWKVLKRALVSDELDVSNPEGPGGGPAVLRPDPLPVDVKVVLAGDVGVYAAMYYGDPEFRNLFKIKAEFEEDAPVTSAVLEAYAAFCARVVQNEGLPHFTRSAVGDCIRWMVRSGGRGGRISTQMSVLSDLLREAACESGDALVHGRHVWAALRARRLRDGLAERRTLELIERGVVRVQTSGRVAGLINALVVYHVGGHDFGRPMRITATVGAGRAGIASVEREVGLSGKSHDKGVQILTGWLRDKLGQTRTLAVTATVCFEQSYGRVDGDSATVTELLALLSALSGLGIDQGVAVTGSVNQLGEIQSVGGINEKIEGFYATCQVQGLTGEQGVCIPATNVPDLCLEDDVVEACARGQFHVWPIATIDEAAERVMGRGLGGDDGVLALCGRALDRYQDVVRLQGKKEKS